ncbi:PAS domain-containing protein [Pontivivens ytuae]|uniref:PAS domain-containing protein n=1 Tax=Pontivivens ytuae TaxID=2789856 RepID=A0A7S9LQP8_9RHOB|nr:PAS domain-containing protein [Pontivivens ytuae]QPH53366.1 PAS domain-containing protein [Pontivivens ytuae]
MEHGDFGVGRKGLRPGDRMDGAMSQHIIDSLGSYWERLRGDRLAPRRSEIDPRAFEDALEHMFILEDTAGAPLRIRLGGTRICDMMGMEVRGLPARALFNDGDRTRAQELMREVIDRPARVDLQLTASGRGMADAPARMILRPLCDDFGDITRILGCLVVETEQFGVETQLTIGAIRLDTLRERAAIPRPVAGFAQEQAAFQMPHLKPIDGGKASTERKPLSRAHLRVVKD